MAPFLSFTAEEAWTLVGHTPSIFTETYSAFGEPDAALLQRWTRIRALRDVVNKEIETLRSTGAVGSSLQANVAIAAPADELALLQSLGDDLRFVLITSAATVEAGESLAVRVSGSSATKCERCWHWRDDVGHDTAHPALCSRCTSNLFGSGEPRAIA
jgi:isoleucyl-tRNA synthetase